MRYLASLILILFSVSLTHAEWPFPDTKEAWPLKACDCDPCICKPGECRCSGCDKHKVVASGLAEMVAAASIGQCGGPAPAAAKANAKMVAPVTYSAPMTYTTTYGDVSTVDAGSGGRQGFFARWRARRAARLSGAGGCGG